ncbi:MAG: hypothetical protein C0598_00510 [Marinilabiliales bacterium]|nr:MAG: hypothetical protein C0598_00510 [Marinilabiliales bacterium]
MAGLDASVNFESLIGKTILGINYKTEHIVSNVLGEAMNDTIFINGSDGYYTKSKTRNNISLEANHLFIKNNFSISAGFSIFHNNDFGTHFSPGIDLGYFINEYIKIFASANKAIRLPTFTDLFYQGPTNTPNPDLKPESSISTEAGFKIFYKNINASLSAFYRDGNNIIDWIKYSPEEKWQSANITQLNTYGISASVNYHLENHIINYLGAKYTWLESEKQNDDIISLYALDYLKHNFNSYLNHNIINNLTASWSLSLQKRNGTYIDYKTSQETEYGFNTLLNLKLIYDYRNFQFNISASNLLNKQYYDIGNIVQPGIWIIAGIKYHLNR